MKKYITQADKLSFLLSIGNITSIDSIDLMHEVISNYNNPNFKSLTTKEQDLNEILEFEKKGMTCYQFTPFNEDEFFCTKIRQFSKNPFTLINLVWDCK